MNPIKSNVLYRQETRSVLLIFLTKSSNYSTHIAENIPMKEILYNDVIKTLSEFNTDKLGLKHHLRQCGICVVWCCLTLIGWARLTAPRFQVHVFMKMLSVRVCILMDDGTLWTANTPRYSQLHKLFGPSRIRFCHKSDSKGS